MVNAEKREVVLETRHLEKHFGGNKAVSDVSIKLFKNEILAIAGDNGAGKSTLIKTITGVYRKDGGEIWVGDRQVEIRNTREAKKYGIEVVYQDKGLVQTLDAPANLFLGREKLKKGFWGRIFQLVDNDYMVREADQLIKQVGADIKDSTVDVDYLSGGQQQSLAVGRAIYWGGKILVFDEPTNNLGVGEQNRTIELIKSIRNQYAGISIILISHNLHHVFELSDRIAVMRNGQLKCIKETSETNLEEMTELITGTE